MAINKMIYVTEDETDILELLQMLLEGAGYGTRGFTRAQQMLDALQEEQPDLIMLDLMLPGIDGMEACRRIKADRQTERIPVVMLTARTDIEDKVRGLEFGADDYITKPFDNSELLARIKAVLRRSEWESAKNVLTIVPGFRIDFNSFEVFIDNRRSDLTLTEFKILQLLTRRPGWVYSRNQILDHLWGTDKIVIERTIDVHIRHLRDKLGDYAYTVKNIRGAGYKFSTSRDETQVKDG